MKEIIQKYNIQSETSSRRYVVSKYDDGSWACSCPSWIFKKGQRVDCKHIKELIHQQEHYVEATIQATEQKKIVVEVRK